MHRCGVLLALAGLVSGCATLAPPRSEPWRDADRVVPAVAVAPAPPPALVAVGDIGVVKRSGNPVHAAIARRLTRDPAIPIAVLGDVFYSHGLLGVCPDRGSRGSSHRSCAAPEPVEAQLEGVLGPFATRLPANPVLAVAGNHDHGGDPESTANACRLLPDPRSGWRYFSRGCGLDEDDPVARVDLPGIALFFIDSEMAIHDADYRRVALAALHAELAAHRQQRPEVWRALVMHHPLESYGRHNGAQQPNALHKDLYLLWQSALAPLYWGFAWLGPPRLSQDLYQWRYRGFRADLYATLREQPVDLVLSGHDHSEQLIEIDHPGVRWQIVSGSGAKRSKVQRFGLDLLGTNRLARLIGLRDRLPAVRHDLRFAWGKGSRMPDGQGFVTLTRVGDALRTEFWASSRATPLLIVDLERP